MPKTKSHAVPKMGLSGKMEYKVKPSKSAARKDLEAAVLKNAAPPARVLRGGLKGAAKPKAKK